MTIAKKARAAGIAFLTASTLAGCASSDAMYGYHPASNTAPQQATPVGQTSIDAVPTGRYITTVPYYNRYYNIITKETTEVQVGVRNIVPNGNKMPSKIYGCYATSIPVGNTVTFDPQTGAPNGQYTAGSGFQRMPCPGFNSYEGIEYPTARPRF